MTQLKAIILLAISGIVFLGCQGDDTNCRAGCEVVSSCTTQSYQSCLDECEADYEEASNFSPSCAAAVNDLAACVGGLTCEEVNAWLEQAPADSYPCRDQQIARDQC